MKQRCTFPLKIDLANQYLTLGVNSLLTWFCVCEYWRLPPSPPPPSDCPLSSHKAVVSCPDFFFKQQQQHWKKSDSLNLWNISFCVQQKKKYKVILPIVVVNRVQKLFGYKHHNLIIIKLLVIFCELSI